MSIPGTIGRSAALRSRVVALADDPGVRVRVQVAFTLGEIVAADPAAVRALASIGRRDADDRWVRTAVLSSAARVAGPLFALIAADDGGISTSGARAVLRELASAIGASGDRHAAAEVFDRLDRGRPMLGSSRPARMGRNAARSMP